jgi:predicted Rossmann-fold nucleotide-binding protein
MQRKQKIIAVFGSSTFLNFAEELGEQITAAGHILLTGADRYDTKNTGTVKDRAIIAAAKINNAKWICVNPGKDDPQIGFSTDRLKRRSVIYTDLGNKRNCLEAFLCDGAIALEGGDGTVSEALFTYSLGKPVFFIGDDWTKDYNITSGAAAGSINFTQMANDAARRVKGLSSVDSPFDLYFERNTMIDRAGNFDNFDWLPYVPTTVKTDVKTVISWLENAINLNLTGYFPPLHFYESVKEDYDNWVNLL